VHLSVNAFNFITEGVFSSAGCVRLGDVVFSSWMQAKGGRHERKVEKVL
jgi:hypothetical protein